MVRTCTARFFGVRRGSGLCGHRQALVTVIAFVFDRWTTIDSGVGVVLGGDAVVLFTFEGVGLTGSFQPIDGQESVDADPATNLIAR
jgi:hypothetical protein